MTHYYNIDFQIAALFIVSVILAFFIHDGLPRTRRTKLFLLQIIACIVNLVFDISSATTITIYSRSEINGIPISDALRIANTILCKTYVITTVTYLYTALLYVANVCHYRGISKRRSQAINVIVIILSISAITVIALTFLEPLYYTGDGFHAWHTGVADNGAYIFGGLCAVTAVIMFILGWKNLSTREKKPIMAFLITQGLVAATQASLPHLLIMGFGNSLAEMFIYKSLRNHELNKHHNNTINSFAEIIEAREKNTGEHIKRTKKYVQIIADELLKINYSRQLINKDWTNRLSQAASLHDLGKLPIPNHVLSKPGRLTDEEFALIKKHPEFGAKIIKESLNKIGDPVFQNLAYEMALTHHERWDGTGYPNHLKGNEIPLSGQIMAIADVFDAVSQNRCYRAAMTLDESFKIISDGIGTHFNPDIATAFIRARPTVERAYMQFLEEQMEASKTTEEDDTDSLLR